MGDRVKFIEWAQHPTCHPDRLPWWKYAWRLVLMMLPVLIGIAIVPSYWWTVLAIILATMFVTHPLCFIRNRMGKTYHHEPGHLLGHFTEPPASCPPADRRAA